MFPEKNFSRKLRLLLPSDYKYVFNKQIRSSDKLLTILARKNPAHKTMVVVATVVMLIVYIIPHSVLGSEIDHTKQETEITE